MVGLLCEIVSVSNEIAELAGVVSKHVVDLARGVGGVCIRFNASVGCLKRINEMLFSFLHSPRGR